MIFRLPKYCVKIKTKAMQASSPSCMPNGSINIINIIVTTQFITERASPHILFFRSPIAPMIRITPKIAPINKIIYRLSWKYWSLKEKYCPMSNLPEPKISAGRAHKTRQSQVLCNPPAWCRIEAPHRRITQNLGLSRKYNDLCRRCVHPCKQSFRAVIIACPHYFSKRSGQSQNLSG